MWFKALLIPHTKPRFRHHRPRLRRPSSALRRRRPTGGTGDRTPPRRADIPGRRPPRHRPPSRHDPGALAPRRLWGTLAPPYGLPAGRAEGLPEGSGAGAEAVAAGPAGPSPPPRGPRRGLRAQDGRAESGSSPRAAHAGPATRVTTTAATAGTGPRTPAGHGAHSQAGFRRRPGKENEKVLMFPLAFIIRTTRTFPWIKNSARQDDLLATRMRLVR